MAVFSCIQCRGMFSSELLLDQHTVNAHPNFSFPSESTVLLLGQHTVNTNANTDTHHVHSGLPSKPATSTPGSRNKHCMCVVPSFPFPLGC